MTLLLIILSIISHGGKTLSSRIVRMPLPADDPKQRRPDIAKAKEVLNWQPITPLREGLKKTIAYFERLLREDPEFCGGGN